MLWAEVEGLKRDRERLAWLCSELASETVKGDIQENNTAEIRATDHAADEIAALLPEQHETAEEIRRHLPRERPFSTGSTCP